MLPSVLLLAACEVTFTNGQPVNTREVAKTSIEMLKAQGFDVLTIRCPDDFAYRKGHETLLCQATVVDGLVVDAPIQFHDATHFNVALQLPDEFTAKGSELVEQSARAYGKDATLVCPPLLVFWKGKDTVTCQITVDGETDDVVLTVSEGRVHFELSSERYIETAQLEGSFAGMFQEVLSLAAKVDCGQPRLALRKPGRKFECSATWEGGRARFVEVFTGPTTDSFIPVETEGLHGPQLEALLALYAKPEAGDAWSCREGTQIVRGQPFTCDFVTSGHKRNPTKFRAQEDKGTFDLAPAARGAGISRRARP
jgi:hypothetical protein